MSPKRNLDSNCGEHNDYFSMLNALLKKDGPGHAVIVLDLDILDSLSGHNPAMFIATPVLKKMQGTTLPFLEFLTPILKRLKRSWATTLFIYGGYWKALPLSPGGLVINKLYGRSTNQEMWNGPENTAVDVDDYVFFRPTQSESVMLQFGDLFVVRSDEIVTRWPVFSLGA